MCCQALPPPLYHRPRADRAWGPGAEASRAGPSLSKGRGGRAGWKRASRGRFQKVRLKAVRRKSRINACASRESAMARRAFLAFSSPNIGFGSLRGPGYLTLLFSLGRDTRSAFGCRLLRLCLGLAFMGWLLPFMFLPGLSGAVIDAVRFWSRTDAVRGALDPRLGFPFAYRPFPPAPFGCLVGRGV